MRNEKDINGNGFFLKLKENKEAKWIVDYLTEWENNMKKENHPINNQHDLNLYLQEVEQMEKLTYASWKHYCKDKA